MRIVRIICNFSSFLGLRRILLGIFIRISSLRSPLFSFFFFCFFFFIFRVFSSLQSVCCVRMSPHVFYSSWRFLRWCARTVYANQERVEENIKRCNVQRSLKDITHKHWELFQIWFQNAPEHTSQYRKPFKQFLNRNEWSEK